MSRSKYKGFFFKLNLFKQQQRNIKIFNKNLIILPEYNNFIINVYNGQKFINLKITKGMIGFKFGEFINTKKRHIYKKKK